MKKCLHMLLFLGIVGLYCARGAVVFCAPDTVRRVQQIEKAILKESRALKALRKRYEDILKRQRSLRAFLEQKKQQERRRAFKNTLVRLRRQQVKEKIMRELLEKQR